jgi:nucleoside-diphosphate-sugar epimerase
MKVLVTGANGFIGRALCENLRESGFQVCAAVRRDGPLFPAGCEKFIVGDIGSGTDWGLALTGVDVVVHLANRAHVLKERSKDPLMDFRKTNVAGTERLFAMAAQAGVRRFIFLSSAGVHGEVGLKKAFCEEDALCPTTAYGVSKWEAELAIRKLSQGLGLDFVILRPPLVYGPGAPGNFARLMGLIKKGIPLPLAQAKHERSFIYIGNLVSAINSCLENPLAARQAFLVSDDEDVSVRDLLMAVAHAMGKEPVLFSLPLGVLNALAKFVGKEKDLEKLTTSFRVNSCKIKELLSWQPPYSLQEGIGATVRNREI